MKIIIRTPGWIGDAVLSLPAIRGLRSFFPEARIWLAGKAWVKDLFATNDFGAETISLSNIASLKTLKDSSETLKTYGFDIGLLLANSFSSALLFYLAKIPERWGYYTDGRYLLLTKRVSPRQQGGNPHQVYYYLNLLENLNIRPPASEITLRITKEEKEAARKNLLLLGWQPQRPLVILHPGASYGPAKRWPPSRFSELAALFQDRINAEILIIGAPEEEELAASIAQSLKKKPIDLTGKTTLRQILGTMSHAALCVTNDSGPLHLANALKVPVVGIFGPTDPRITGPFQQPSTVVKKDVPCWPCLYRECPYDHRCMMAIDPQQVYEASQKFVG